MVCGRLRTFSIFSAFERDDIVVRSCSVVVLCWACTSPFVFLFVESPVNFFVSHFVVFYVRWDSAKFRYSARFSARTNGEKPGGAPLRNIHFLVFVLLFLRATETSDLKS